MQEVEAIYENGVLRPLGPLALKESQTVRLLIAASSSGARLDGSLLDRAKAEVAASPNGPTLEEIRRRLSVIPGSMADVVAAERGEY